jgi:asparagine synthase (glutamine-hydrolysing)
MCGIAGVVRWRREALANENITDVVCRMASSMSHRGPDADGVWTDTLDRCVLGHRRLSIIDTSDAGRQPMEAGNGRWLITFNGEIYNFVEIKSVLETKGVRFRGRTDTEVLIEGIGQWGVEVLPKLDGMFAFGAFDTVTGELLLARDPFGEKPLYYMELDGGLAFASELQALEQMPGFDNTISIDAMAEVLTFQYVGAPRTIYRNVKKLPPATWLRVGANGRVETGRYFEFRPGCAGFTDRALPALVDELEEILTRSIRRRLISDVPLGAFLSGGVDSSTACALIRRKLQLPLKTFSIGFKNAPESEHVAARAFAKHLGTEHFDDILTPDVTGFLSGIGKALDEPNGDSSCLPTYLLSGFARRQVTVAISGDGGDEMFGGYGRYFATLDELRAFRAGKLSNWKPGATYYGGRILVSSDAHISDLFGNLPAGFAEHLTQLRKELDDSETQLLCAMRQSDAENYLPGAVLPKVDRMSMQHSLEVRTPYLSMELARFAERLPDAYLVRGQHGKIILRELAYRYLPKDLIDLPKKGFGMPMSDWARSSMLDVAQRLLEGDDSRMKAALGGDAIGHFMTRQRARGQFSIYEVWGVAMLESWLRHHSAKVPQFDKATRFHASMALPQNEATVYRMMFRNSGRLRRAIDIARPFLRMVPFAARTKRLMIRLIKSQETQLNKSETTNKAQLEKIKQFIGKKAESGFALRPGDRVVVCTHALPPGGAERQWVYLAQGLLGLGYDVHFVTYHPLKGDNCHYLPLLRSSGIPHVDASTLPLPDQNQPLRTEMSILLGSDLVPARSELSRLWTAIGALSPKVVFAQLDGPNLLAGFASLVADVPRVVLSFRNYNPTNFPYLRNDWFLPVYRLLAISERVLFSGNHRGANDDYAQWIGIPPDRVACIHNAIDREIFPDPTPEQLAKARGELGVDEHTPIILGVFRLSEEKDPLTFVDVCARVRDRIPNLHVFIVGVGPMLEKLEARAAGRGLGETLRFLGRRRDVNVLMGMSSLLLLTSLKEGMPNVVLEAQSLGTPVVATDVGAVSEIVSHGETALLCQAGDVDGLASTCAEFLSDPAKARRFGDAGRQRMATKFEKRTMAQGYLDLVNGQSLNDSGDGAATLECVNS